jgi:hypothetical protein
MNKEQFLKKLNNLVEKKAEVVKIWDNAIRLHKLNCPHEWQYYQGGPEKGEIICNLCGVEKNE